MIRSLLLAIVVLSLFCSCAKKPASRQLSSADSMSIVQENLTHRAEVDSSFRYDSGSPFVRDTTIEFLGVKWFPIDVRFR
ncbi:MAG: hypothetical protein HW412_1281, partial [Bacteroidetes bacterium]|nr:hypothetical protein [Bacteroidota bacterium]